MMIATLVRDEHIEMARRYNDFITNTDSPLTFDEAHNDLVNLGRWLAIAIMCGLEQEGE